MRLNAAQGFAIKWAIAIMVLALVLVPWRHQNGGPAGYGFLFSPPQFQYGSPSVDLVRLSIQVLIVAIVFGAIVFFNRDEPKDQGPPPPSPPPPNAPPSV